MTTVNGTNDTLQSLGLAKTAEKKSALNSKLGQDQFLELMIAQLKNQDPLKPMQSGEFLTQIASFSTVSGIQDLQKSFQELAGSMYSNQALQASALVGRTVLVPGSTGNLGATGGMSGLAELTAGTTNFTVSVLDPTGQLVRRMDLGQQQAGQVAFSWDGMTDSGARAAPGLYQFRAESRVGNQAVAAESFVTARVDSVSLGRQGEGITLNLNGLGAIDFAQVRQIQ